MRDETSNNNSAVDTRVNVSQYLMTRLKQFDIDHFFGVPGDFILPFFMQHEADHQGLQYVGTCNELDAGYAADGYARACGKPSRAGFAVSCSRMRTSTTVSATPGSARTATSARRSTRTNGCPRTSTPTKGRCSPG